jgi:hypothetical protein
MIAARHRSVIIAVAGALFCASAPPAAGGGVVGTGTPGSCTEAALDAALAEGGAVSFDCGGSTIIAFSQVKGIAVDTRIDGGGLITLSGGGAVQVFRVEPDARLELVGLTVADGFAGPEPGGAIRNLGTLSIRDTLLVANATHSFGGALANEGQCEVVDSQLIDNHGALGGGGVANFRRLAVSRSTLFRNSAGYDPARGGLYEDPGSGGGIANYGTLTLANSTLSSNVAIPYDSGALFVAAFGGGLYNVGDAVVVNSTLSRNASRQSCGGIANNGTLTVRNTLIAHTVGIGCCSDFGTVTAASAANLLDQAAEYCGPSFTGVPPEALRLTGLADHGGATLTTALLPGSVAIGAGDVESCAAAPVGGDDQRGRPRLAFDDTRCDVGAFERSPGDPAPEAGATFLSMRGEPDDYILGNDSRFLQPSDGRFRVDHAFGSVSLDFEGQTVGIFWHLDFNAPAGRELVPGTYEIPDGPFDPAASRMWVGGEGRGCGRLRGRFSVRETAWAIDGTVERLAVDFAQHCEQGVPALFGNLRINSNVPTASPEPGTPLPTRTPTVPSPTAPPPLMACSGDCAQDGRVSIADVVLGVGIALGIAPVAACPDVDGDLNGSVTISELLLAVKSAVAGCL